MELISNKKGNQNVHKLYQQNAQISRIKEKKNNCKFKGGSTTSDGGGILLREADRQINLLAPIAKALRDKRDKDKIQHSILSMLRQRVFGLALGNDDLNDHNDLCKDIAFQTFVGVDSKLASSPTLCRFENSATRKAAVDISKQTVEVFISSHKEPPEKLILDFDATDDLVHGNQVGRFFHGYYKNYCFLPLYVFCGSKLLVAYLRPSNKDGALHTWAILALLVKRFRKEWPNVEIVFRGDGGFCRHKMFSWCEKKGVKYIAGIAKKFKIGRIFEAIDGKGKKYVRRNRRKAKIIY